MSTSLGRETPAEALARLGEHELSRRMYDRAKALE